jgi:hypothetical protein
MKRQIFILLPAMVLLPVLAPALAWAEKPAVLPGEFNGWKLEQATFKTSADPAAADAADPAVLKEYGFNALETASYSRNGRRMEVRAARFNDASGAYGAFTFYLQPQMGTADIGDRAASSNSRVLFYRGNILVDAQLEQVTAMSAADLRALAEALPHPHGSQAALPTLPGNLPKQSRLPNTERYVVGPVALERLGVPVPASLVDFNKGPEIVSAKYRSSSGEATLTLIAYPTPQIAAERLRAFQAAFLPGVFKRTGPILAIASGRIPLSEAESLLASVNYDADVTWNEPAKPNPTEDRAAFIVAEVMLVVVFLAIALGIGLAYGWVRVAVKRLVRGKTAEPSEDVEIIRLNLK